MARPLASLSLSMETYTLIGFWPDTEQRFATHIDAVNPAMAEDECSRLYPGVQICGVLRGQHECVDSDHLAPRAKQHGLISRHRP